MNQYDKDICRGVKRVVILHRNSTQKKKDGYKKGT